MTTSDLDIYFLFKTWREDFFFTPISSPQSDYHWNLFIKNTKRATVVELLSNYFNR